MSTRNCTICATERLFRAVAIVMFVCGFALVLVPAGKAATTEFKVIHTFQGKKDGEYPEAGLTLSDGQMFSTTFGSLGKPGKVCSKGGCGNNFAIQGKHLTPGYSFEGGQDGAFPTGEVVVNNNIIFGITEYGGGSACNGLGCGTAFAVQGNMEVQRFQFCSKSEFPVCANGAFPRAGPIIGSDGNLYGTTSLGGAGTGYECDNNFGGCGTVYELTPDFSMITVLYSFCQEAACEDGAIPFGRLWQDPSSGNFFGTTQFGGAYGQGIVFELSPGTNGQWIETILHNFCAQTNCTDGAIPEAGLIEDGSGNLYGTASAGGGGDCQGSSPGCGAVFELAADGTYSVLHPFTGGTDGALPQAPLVLHKGNLYGTTEKGGDGPACLSGSIGCGTVFMLSLDGSSWTETILHTFGAINRTDGAQPEGSLLLSNGSLYGATLVEGHSNPECNCGTLFKLGIGSRAPAKRWRAQGQVSHRNPPPDESKIRSD